VMKLGRNSWEVTRGRCADCRTGEGRERKRPLFHQSTKKADVRASSHVGTHVRDLDFSLVKALGFANSKNPAQNSKN
jgi:hypothetical protein